MFNVRLDRLSPKRQREPLFFGALKRLFREDDGALLVRLDRTFPGEGVTVRNDTVYLQSGLALSGTTQQTFPIPATGVILGTTTGKIRVKVYNGGGTSPTLVQIQVNATDGTNTVPVFTYRPNTALALSTTQWYDGFFAYLLDTASATANAGGATGQLLPGGATSFNVLTTLGGTSATASMDVEICPLV